MAEPRRSTSDTEDVWVYHEKQVFSLCGQHCINNLVQGPYHTAADLAEIAQELDERERHMLEEGDDSSDETAYPKEDWGNVDVSGNFSFQVLNAALTRRHGICLKSLDSESVGGLLTTTGSSREIGFILNRHDHWIAIRLVGGTYWDLNSTLEYPARLTAFALEATLDQHRKDGYSVFVVRGEELPPPAVGSPGEGSRDCWYRMKDLLEVSSAKGGAGKPGTAATDVWLNSGRGQRLDGGSMPGPTHTEDVEMAMAISASMAEQGNRSHAATAATSQHDDDEDDVARAIALSLRPPSPAEHGSVVPTAASRQEAGVYVPQAVGEEPTGDGVVRVKFQLDGGKQIVRRFRADDPVSSLVDVAAHALAESDGRHLSAPLDVTAPQGRVLLKGSRFMVGQGSLGGKECTIGSEGLGGARVFVRRAR